MEHVKYFYMFMVLVFAYAMFGPAPKGGHVPQPTAETRRQTLTPRKIMRNFVLALIEGDTAQMKEYCDKSAAGRIDDLQKQYKPYKEQHTQENYAGGVGGGDRQNVKAMLATAGGEVFMTLDTTFTKTDGEWKISSISVIGP